MNHREFVKVLAGIPLLGLLVKLPKAEERPNLIMPSDPEYVDVTVDSIETNTGNLIFCDPYTDKGDDANDGLTPETPVASPERVLALASAPRGDVIIWFGRSDNQTIEEEL